MAVIDLPYIQRFKDRHGRARHYVRRPGCKRIALPGLPGSPEFMRAYEAAIAAGPQRRPIGADRTKPGTLDALLVAFYASADWAALKANTQANYRNIYERLRADYGHNAVAALDRQTILALLDDKAATPGAARSFLKRLCKLLDFAVDRAWIPANPARQNIRPPRQQGDGFRAWSEADIAAFEAAHPPGSRARLALDLLLYTGQRRSDVVAMGRQHVTADTIHVLQIKGLKGRPRTRLAIPLHPRLRAALDALPKTDLTFLMTAYGRPMSAAGFTSWFVEQAKAAGLPAGCAPHGLRKAAARRLAEAGCSTLEIMAITGHKTLAEIERYTRSVAQERMAGAAMEALSRDRPGTAIVKP